MDLVESFSKTVNDETILQSREMDNSGVGTISPDSPGRRSNKIPFGQRSSNQGITKMSDEE